MIGSWHDQSATTHKAVRYLNTGPHRVQIEFYEHGGQASAAFWMDWLQRPSRPKS